MQLHQAYTTVHRKFGAVLFSFDTPMNGLDISVCYKDFIVSSTLYFPCVADLKKYARSVESNVNTIIMPKFKTINTMGHVLDVLIR